MEPSKRWFPSSLNERAVWMNNFASQFAVVAGSLGFSAADITSMTKDNEDFQAMARAVSACDALMDAMRSFRISLTEAHLDSPSPSFPNVTLVPPPNGVPAGIFQRLDDRVRRIRAAPAYTSSIGALLNIIPHKPESLVENEITPVIKAAAFPGNVIEVRFTRSRTHGLFLQMKLDNDGEWTSAGRFVRSPAQIEIPNTDGRPRSVQLRARYLIGNDPAGLNSDIVTVVSIP
jgi:hypothetical protein